MSVHVLTLDRKLVHKRTSFQVIFPRISGFSEKIYIGDKINNIKRCGINASFVVV